MRVLVTGARAWKDRDTISLVLRRVFDANRTAVLVVGDARGADAIAEEIWQELGGQVEKHPADWDRHGKAAGFIRNVDMVKAGADVCIAFPAGKASGTKHCMRAARKAGIPVFNYGEIGPPSSLERELRELERTDPDVRAARERYDDMVHDVLSGKQERIRAIYGDQ